MIRSSLFAALLSATVLAGVTSALAADAPPAPADAPSPSPAPAGKPQFGTFGFDEGGHGPFDRAGR